MVLIIDNNGYSLLITAVSYNQYDLAELMGADIRFSNIGSKNTS